MLTCKGSVRKIDANIDTMTDVTQLRTFSSPYSRPLITVMISEPTIQDQDKT